MKKERVFIIVFVFLFVLGIVLVFTSGSNGSKIPVNTTAAPTRSTTGFPQPTYPVFLTTNQNIKYDTSALRPSPADSLKAFAVSQRVISQDQLVALAQKHGFSGQATIMNTAEGVYYRWERGAESLVVGGIPATVNYFDESKLSSAPISDDASVFLTLSDQFVSKYQIAPNNYTLSSPSISYLSPVGNDPNYTTKESAKEIIVSRFLLINQTSFFWGYPTNPAFSVRYNNQRNIISFSYVVPPTITASEGPVAIVSQQNAFDRLRENKGSVVSAFSREDKNMLSSLDYSFGSVTVRGVALSYFFSPAYKALIPTYVFNGKAKDVDTDKDVDVVIFVSAIP